MPAQISRRTARQAPHNRSRVPRSRWDARLLDLNVWRIDGSPQAKRDIRSALRLIRDLPDQRSWRLLTAFHPRFETDPVKYGVAPGLGVIKINNSQRSYYGTNSIHPGINRLNKTENTKWLAGSIVHESVHAAQVRRRDSYIGAVAEKEAMIVQLRFLDAVNATSDMRNYIMSEIDNVNSPDSYWRHYDDQQIRR